MKFFLHPPAWLSAARLPLQAAILAYVGAGGLAGAAVVGGVMLSPVREAVQEAVAPARLFVESVMPQNMPSIFPTDPRPAVASQPIDTARPASAASPIATTAPLVVDDRGSEVVAALPTPTPQVRLVAPPRSDALAQPALQPAVQPGQPALGPMVAEPPVAAFERTAPVMPGRLAVGVAGPDSSRTGVVSEAPARATAALAATRVTIGGANSDNQRAAAAASPTALAVHAANPRPTEPPPAAPVVPTPHPTSVPAAAPTPIPATPVPAEVPTQAPTQAPTAAPTHAPTAAPTQAPTAAPTHAPPHATSVPTAEPKKTTAPTAQPTQTAVPTQVPPHSATPTSAPTSVPAHAVSTATPVPNEPPAHAVSTATPVQNEPPTSAPTATGHNATQQPTAATQQPTAVAQPPSGHGGG